MTTFNATDAGTVNSWVISPVAIPNVKYLAGDVDNLSLSAQDADAIQQNFILATPFTQAPWVYSEALGTTTVIPPALFFRPGILLSWISLRQQHLQPIRH